MTSVSSLIADGAARLAAAGIPGPRREVLRIWADLTGAPPARALLEPTRPAGPDDAARFEAAIERRAGGEPLAYVTGWAGFRHLTLRADRRALIPRPETEGLVDLALARVREGVAADIGTGTGCLALSLATEGRFRAVVAVDRSIEALRLADTNRKLVGARVALVQGDLTTPLRSGSVDLVVANPPYLTLAEYMALAPSVRGWEPADALASGVSGLDATERLLEDARRVLRSGGWLALEVDCARAAAAAELARRLRWTEVTVTSDLFERERYLLARRSMGS